MSTDKAVQQVQDLRRSNAAQPVPAKKVRRRRTRGAQRAAAIKEEETK